MRTAYSCSLTGVEGKAWPNYQHQKALMELTDNLGLGHLFTDPWDATGKRPAAAGA